MSQSKNTQTVHCASEKVNQSLGSDLVYVNSEANDVITVVHVNDLNDDGDDDASSICTNSSNESINTSCEPKIIEKLGLENHPNYVTYNNIHIQNSTDVVVGTKAVFNEPVIIHQVQQLIVNGGSGLVNHSWQHLTLPDSKGD